MRTSSKSFLTLPHVFARGWWIKLARGFERMFPRKPLIGVLALGLFLSACYPGFAEDSGYARVYANVLKRMDETPLLPLPKKSSSRIYRLVIAPAWGDSFGIRIESNENGASMVIKQVGWRVGADDYSLAKKKELHLTFAEFLSFEEVIRKSRYEEMRTLDKTDGFDGEIWSMEVSRAQFHDAVSSWCPNDSDSKTRGTEGFVRIFQWAANKAGIAKTITNKGHPIFER